MLVNFIYVSLSFVISDIYARRWFGIIV